MKNFLKSTVLSLAVLCLCACDDDKSYEDPGLEVTPHNIAGTWQLAEWNGAPLAEGSFVYIEFTRKDKLFTMYQNLDSFSTRKLTGRYDITTDVELGRSSWDSTTTARATGSTGTSCRTSTPTQ